MDHTGCHQFEACFGLQNNNAVKSAPTLPPPPPP
jgi:hypothetical protein